MTYDSFGIILFQFLGRDNNLITSEDSLYEGHQSRQI